MTMTIVEGNLGSGEILSGPVCPYRYMVPTSMMMMLLVSFDYDDDGDEDDNDDS